MFIATLIAVDCNFYHCNKIKRSWTPRFHFTDQFKNHFSKERFLAPLFLTGWRWIFHIKKVIFLNFFEKTLFKPSCGIFACVIADICVWMLPESESKDWNFHTCVGSWFLPKRQLCLCFEEWRRCHGLYTDPSPPASGNTPHLLSSTGWRFA